MPLEHDDAPRFTPDQRDAILNLAARLQVQHETTVGTDELMRAAEEAGIDPRFVHEAATRLGRKSRPRHLRGPLFAFVLFTVQACLLMANQYVWFKRGDTGLEWPDVALAIGMALPLALWAARQPLVRRFVALAPLVVWIAVGLLALGLTNAFAGLGLDSFVMPTVITYGLAQMLAAFVGMSATALLHQAPRDLKSFRLYRGHGA